MPRPEGRPITTKKKFTFYRGCTHSRIFPDSPIYNHYIEIFGEPEEQTTPDPTDTSSQAHPLSPENPNEPERDH